MFSRIFESFLLWPNVRVDEAVPGLERLPGRTDEDRGSIDFGKGEDAATGTGTDGFGDAGEGAVAVVDAVGGGDGGTTVGNGSIEGRADGRFAVLSKYLFCAIWSWIEVGVA